MECRTCRFWDPLPHTDKVNGDAPCRRYAPSPVPFRLLQYLIGSEDISRTDTWPEWPETNGGDWCGDYEAKDPIP